MKKSTIKAIDKSFCALGTPFGFICGFLPVIIFRDNIPYMIIGILTGIVIGIVIIPTTYYLIRENILMKFIK